MSMLGFHPAPGFGELLPGSFVVPQNPIRDAGTPLVPSVQAANGGQISYRPHIGELLPGMFTVPQNPILLGLAQGVGQPNLGCAGGGCGGSCNGMSGLDLASATGFLTEPLVAGIPGWMVLAGAVVAYMVISPGGSDYRAARRTLDAEHRGYRRASRAAGARLSAA